MAEALASKPEIAQLTEALATGEADVQEMENECGRLAAEEAQMEDEYEASIAARKRDELAL